MIVSLISSQIYRDNQIILNKMNLDVLTIDVTPAFFKDGVLTMVLLDGHHSFEAAKRTQREPDINIMEEDIEVELLYDNDIQMFLDWHSRPCDNWYQIGILEGDFYPVNI